MKFLFWAVAALFASAISAVYTLSDTSTKAVTVVERSDPPADVKSDRLPTYDWAQPNPDWEGKMREVYWKNTI